MSKAFSDKKITRKQARCSAIVSREVNIPTSNVPTQYIGICNAGLSTGVTEEAILQETQKYGQISQLVLIPNKSYCFLVFNDSENAAYVFRSMHGKAGLGQNASVIYMSYFKTIPQVNNPLQAELPIGAVILEDFVSEAEERILLEAINYPPSGALKNRCVKHFGYEFLYDSNLVDPEKPLETGIPSECEFLWKRLGEKLPSLNSFIPDQLTVNHYMPGHGIPPHVDTHSAFEDPILSLSLESGIMMDFRKSNHRAAVFLPRRSMLIMSGECRYDWTHGITPRFMDVVQTPNNTLTTQKRYKRTSFTFRKIKRSPCNCIFPALCDSQQHSKESKESLEHVAQKLEEANVHNIYEQIANHFSETRHSPWPNVAEFVRSFPLGSVIMDIGCGNGKYLSINKDALQIGCDRSAALLCFCCSNKQQAFKCDCLSLPVRSLSIDGVISIAVIHHLASETRRIQSVKEMARVLRPGGLGLIYVWAKDQKRNSKKSSYLRQNKAVNKGKVSESEQRQKTQDATKHIDLELNVQLPVHTNRTEFLDQDVLVPWKLKSTEESSEKSTFLRYYHVFDDDELESLCKQVSGIEVEKCFYDQGNHCVIFKKL